MTSELSSVSRESMDRLRQYEALLRKWQKAINLVGPATLDDAWNRHFVDSLQILPLLPPGKKTLYDLGSGAGFPGLVLAMARPDLIVTLIESDQRKGAFLSTVSHETGVPVKVISERIESVAKVLDAPDIVTARALAPLSDLLVYVRPWAERNPNLICIFPKGQAAEGEIRAAQGIAEFDIQTVPSSTDPLAQILLLSSLRFRS